MSRTPPHTLETLFPTPLYRASLSGEPGFAALNADLEATIHGLAQDDRAGRAWAKAHAYGGYTSYASLDDLPRRATVFADLKRRLDAHVTAFAQDLALDLGPRGRLTLDSLWVNLLRRGGAHSGHIHPNSVISGTYYVSVPAGAGALRLEDPRLVAMMAAPPRRRDAPPTRQSFVTIAPAPGDLLMWESWLRHEVLPSAAAAPRLSVSFNYGWS
jgi:uncharacterized protein (TIGR02466 family)